MADVSRRNFVTASALVSAASISSNAQAVRDSISKSDRDYWIAVLTRLADPILLALSKKKLKATMPVEAPHGNAAERSQYTHLEALGRLLAGISPWLESGDSSASERELRQRYS